jgi:hypothetical protein
MQTTTNGTTSGKVPTHDVPALYRDLHARFAVLTERSATLNKAFAVLAEHSDALAWLAGEEHDDTGADEAHLWYGIDQIESTMREIGEIEAELGVELSAQMGAIHAVLVRLRQAFDGVRPGREP